MNTCTVNCCKSKTCAESKSISRYDSKGATINIKGCPFTNLALLKNSPNIRTLFLNDAGFDLCTTLDPKK